MKKIAKLSLFLSGTSLGIYCTVLNQKNKQNIHGAYLSFVNSCKSTWILYESFRDYQQSLNHIPYNTDQYHEARHQVHLRVANRILKLSRQNRGIYLKLGQYLGNLDKVVPWEFTHVLKVLQDSAPPLPYSEMKTIFTTDLQLSSQEIFSFIDQQPLAAASLAQVHKAKLAKNGKQVAIKMQYPFLKVQSKWDLLILKHLTYLCNYLGKKFKNSDFDFVKLFNEWTSTLVEQLDFKIEVCNAQRVKKNFNKSDKIYIPEYYTQLCSDRLIVMEYVQGIKITEQEQMIKQGIKLESVRNNLLDIFTQMIFTDGFVHCDAHPGNFFIRKKNNSAGHQIVLLDHGLYRQLSVQNRHSFSGLLVNLLLQDKQKLIHFAEKLNIHNHFEYIPIIFFQRLKNSTKKMGEDITDEQKKQFRKKDLSKFESIYEILNDLPPQIMYIIRTFSLISAHFSRLGGSRRQRIFTFTQSSLKVLYTKWLSYRIHYMWLILRVWFFQLSPKLYRKIYGQL